MKQFLFIPLIALGINAKAQITLEYTYDSASSLALSSNNFKGGQLLVINFEISGERYVRINRMGDNISIYDMNHSLLKVIDCSALPHDNVGNLRHVMYLSETLFDTDPGMEFMYVVVNGGHYTGIYNEDGSLIFSDSANPAIYFNIHLQQYPIYNTSQGTKMILSYENVAQEAKVYSLPGTLSMGIQEGNSQLIQAQGNISNAYPNPTNSTTRIDYTFLNGVNQGEIVFYDLQGKEIKRYKVDKTFDHLLISTADIQAGTYFYQLQTTAAASEGKKMLVIK